MQSVSNNNVRQQPQALPAPTAGAPRIAGRPVTAAPRRTRREWPHPWDSRLEKAPSAMVENVSTFLTTTELVNLAKTSRYNNDRINKLPAFTSAAAADLRMARVAVIQAGRHVQAARLEQRLILDETRRLTEKVDAFKASIRWYQRAPLAELEAFADNLRDALASREELDVKLQKLMEELVERRSQQAQYRIAFQAAVAAGGKIDMDAPD
jgi:hypothetical protein